MAWSWLLTESGRLRCLLSPCSLMPCRCFVPPQPTAFPGMTPGPPRQGTRTAGVTRAIYPTSSGGDSRTRARDPGKGGSKRTSVGPAERGGPLNLFDSSSASAGDPSCVRACVLVSRAGFGSLVAGCCARDARHRGPRSASGISKGSAAARACTLLGAREEAGRASIDAPCLARARSGRARANRRHGAKAATPIVPSDVVDGLASRVLAGIPCSQHPSLALA
ncbi:hypothetical protein C8Q77DRAFT_665542 [Trametes polyzona]|nr:hypothetical protein C8Q77DRAFT_665542 [Trametes polyzona]